MKKISLLCGIAMMMAQPALAQSRPVQVAAATPKPAPVAPTPARAPQLPPPEAMIILIRSSLVALSQANLTNNYTVLSTLGSPGFRAANPPQKLAQTFASFRENRIDMNPVVFVTPQLSQQPIIAGGKLRLVGYFPTQPMRVDYDLQFEPDGGTWKLFGMAVNLNRPAAAQAPSRVVAPGAR
jgi:hypothetical protein